MVEGDLVSLVVVAYIVVLLSVDPGSAKETRTFTFLLTYDFAATYAVAHQLVLRCLTVADLAARNQEFAEVSFDLLCSLAVSTKLFLLLDGLALDFLGLILI